MDRKCYNNVRKLQEQLKFQNKKGGLTVGIQNEKNLRWYNLAVMAFIMVWGFGNVVNNYANQGLTVIVSWILINALYFIPYALMVGELVAIFK